MSDLHTQYVDPRPNVNPHIPVGTTCIPLHPISLWPIGTIPSVYVFPGEIDLARLVEAVKDVSAVWPTIAGRYVRKERPSDPNQSAFCIDLTSSPIPVTTQTIAAARAFETRRVIQPTLHSYMPSLDPAYHEPNRDVPLLALRLTTLLPSRRCVLGISWAHILGDASTCNLFIQHLSLFYANGPDAKLDTQHMPTFSPHITMSTYPPSENALDTYQVRQVYPSHALLDARKAYMAAAQGSEPMVVVLSRAELGAMMQECTREGTNFLSTQDVLSAWWITVLRRAGQEVEKLIYTINYRSYHQSNQFLPSNLPTLAGNVAQMLQIKLPSAVPDTASETEADTVAIALAIRSGINKLRQNPQHTIDWLTSRAFRLEEAAEQGRGQLVLPGDGEALVNSNLRYNWVIPFGFPWDKTSFHTAFTAPRFLRVFEANPEAEEKYGETNVELAFNVIKGGKEKNLVEDIIAGDRKRWASATTSAQ